MLTNQIAQLEVGNFHKHLPRGGYFLPKAMLIHVLFFSGHGTGWLHHSVSVSMQFTLQWTLDYPDLDYPDPRLSGSRTDIIARAYNDLRMRVVTVDKKN